MINNTSVWPWHEIDDITKLPLEQSWVPLFSKEFEQPYFKKLQELLKKEDEYTKKQKLYIYFPQRLMWLAFNITPLPTIKVVIIGQDCYHNGTGMGLAFSGTSGGKIPPSLNTMYECLLKDPDVPKFSKMPTHPDLTSWSIQGVLLMNCGMTVRQGHPKSHLKYWEPFSNAIINYISETLDFVVFLLFGEYAKKKKDLISKKHEYIETQHPSPMSRHPGQEGIDHPFVTTRCFSKANKALVNQGIIPINWESVLVM